MRPRHVVVLWTALLVCLPAAAGPGEARPKIKIARDTTFITKPLKPDGTPDYLGAINQQFGAGVTGANNAAIPLLRALGPDWLPEETGRQITAKLGLAFPPGGKYLRFPPKDTPADKQLRSGWERPWTAKQHPELVKWLKAHDGQLATVIAASKRTRYYLPAVAGKKEPALLCMEIPLYEPIHQAVRALLVRAALAAGEGRGDDAVADVTAAYRLGVLFGQDYSLVGNIVGSLITRRSMEAMASLAVSRKLSARQALALIGVLRTGAPPSAAEALRFERYANLDTFIWFARKPSAFRMGNLVVTVEQIMSDDPTLKKPRPGRRPADALFERADYNEVLRRANAVFDMTVAATRPRAFADRVKAGEAISPMVGAIKKGTLPIPHPQADQKTATKWVTSMLVGVFTPTLGRAVVIMDRVRVRRSVTAVALALAAHRAETGSYPADLKVLAPKYLKRVPIDWCSGKPLSYARSGDGFVLYSVGENMRDDRGRDRTHNKSEDDDYDDIVVKAPPGA